MRMSRGRLLRGAFAGLFVAGAAVYCGGGGIGGTGGISGFGSIFVNGVEWFTDTAEITLDGEPGSEADLRLGMIVDVQGQPFLGGVSATADTVRFDDAVQGPVSSLTVLSPTTVEAEILGHTVEIDSALTQFDPSDPSFAFSTLAVDDVLEVSGHEDGSGGIRATWLRRLGVLALGETEVELEGSVAGLSGASFALGPVTVLIGADTDLSGLGVPLADGVEVEVEGILVAAATVEAESVSDVDSLPEQIAEYDLEGIVSGFVSLGDFQVAGQPVDASGAEFAPPDPAFVEDGALVEVEGPIVGGILLAESVALRTFEVKMHAAVASATDVDALAGRITLLGVELELAPDALYEDERDGLPGFGLADVSAGDFLEVVGFESGTGEVLIEALKRVETGDVVLRGPVTGFGPLPYRVHVCGVSVRLNASTLASDATGAPIAPAPFFRSLKLWDEVELVDHQDGDQTAIDAADEIAFD
jgi:hypothetical protein